ncbi:FAD-linked sulfhydryl oxidase ERV1 [Zostera marina]|uniref:Sulfhydryl oxidase n=1 Tax=Zostera marina TaxID=29655 RepID=A0A0K9NM36_ZOSMR|nr:FAD-linked sulfhydryl oxidase ERV1 [Zostera marina]
MSEQNPLEAILKTCESIVKCAESHLSNLFNHRLYQQQQEKKKKKKNRQTELTTEPTEARVFSAQSRENPPPSDATVQMLSIQAISPTVTDAKEKVSAEPLTKELVGRATWTFLHAVAAQFPDKPTKQQRRDVKELMAIVSRLYPCKECSDHFKGILKSNPVQAESQAELSNWLCHIHNVVNRSLGKKIFPCHRVDARWGKLDCPDRACDVGDEGLYQKNITNK